MDMKKKWIYKLFILFPFIDVITSLLIRHYNLIITPGLIVKGLFVLIMFVYIFFSKSKYKNITIGWYFIFFIYIFLYFLTKPELLSSNFIFKEINYLFKFFYFPAIFFALLCFYDSENFDKKQLNKVMLINLISITFLLILPIILGNAYETYSNNYLGTIGWFYGGNEISNIMILLYPFIIYFITDKKLCKLFLIIPIVYSIFSIGTKASLWGLHIINIFIIVYFILKNKKLLTRQVIISIIIFTTCFLFKPLTLAPYKLINTPPNKKVQGPVIVPEKIIIDSKKEERIKSYLFNLNQFYKKNKTNLMIKKLLSGRDTFLANTLSIYDNEKTPQITMFGIGFSNTKSIDNTNIDELIEMDILDAYFHVGVLGLLIMVSPFFITFILIIKSKKKVTLDSLYYILIIFLVMGVSTVAGHVLGAPGVSIYLIVYLLFLLNEFKLLGEKSKLNNKISLLSLHLGYGGIETSIVNQANMLSEKYEVDLIVLYKLSNENNYKLNKNVNLIYLSNLEPNKNEFISAFKKFNIFKCLKEGFKSIYILYKKKSLMKNYIYNANSKVIISTRLEFTKILSDYGNEEAIKIAEEHVYHNNDKQYINQLKISLMNIDYLIPASNYLTEDYKEFYKDIRIKIIYIPQTINYLPEKTNDLKNKNIIFVGRLEQIKGLIDLIDIFNLAVLKDRKLKLTIVGDGTQKKELQDLIKKYNLTDNIKLTGYLSGNRLKKEYQKASLFVMTSYEESFGLVLLEAMSYGVPCFAFDSSLGAKEIINNKNGLLIKNRDKKSMANEILSFFENNNKIKISKFARKTSEEYYTEKVKIKWYNFIDRIIKE